VVVNRGGAFTASASALLVSMRANAPAGRNGYLNGVRCARAP
jgi:hypothetical protein